jgi:hypothetical protein
MRLAERISTAYGIEIPSFDDKAESVTAVVEAESRLDNIFRRATTGDQTISKRGTRHGVEVASWTFSLVPPHLEPRCVLVPLLQ